MFYLKQMDIYMKKLFLMKMVIQQKCGEMDSVIILKELDLILVDILESGDQKVK